MKQFEYVIKDVNGIHARPAGVLVELLSKHNSTVTIKKGEMSADAKKVDTMMSLGVKEGDTVLFTAEGLDEEDTINTISVFVQASL